MLGSLLLFLLLGVCSSAWGANLSISQLSDSISPWQMSDGTTVPGVDNSDPLPVGGIIVYDVSLSNTDLAAANNVAAIFDLPAGSKAVDLPIGCVVDAGVATRVVCTFASIPGSGTTPMKLKVDTQGMSPGPVIIHGAVGNAGATPPATTLVKDLLDSNPFFADDSNPSNNRLNQQTTLTNAADLALSKSASPASVIGGAEVTYTLTVTNHGPSVSTGFNVVDSLPAGTVLVPGSFSGNGPGWSFNPGTTTASNSAGLQVGASTTFSFRAKVNLGTGTITNHAHTVSTGLIDPRPDNNNAQVDTQITDGADLTLSMIANPAPATTDQEVNFVLTAKNEGPSASADVTVTGTLPTGFVYNNATAPAGWGCTVSGVNVTCTRTGSMPSGATESLTLHTTAPGTPGDYSASMQIASATTPDPNDPTHGVNNNTATTQVAVLADGADLALTKSKVSAVDGGPKVPAGDTADSDMRSTFTLTNNGPSRITNDVQIVEVLALGEEYKGKQSGPFNCSANPFVWSSGTRQVVTCIYAGTYPVAVTNPNNPSPFATLNLITRAREEGDLVNNACTGGSEPTNGVTSLPPQTESGVNLDKIASNNCAGSGVTATAQAADLSISKATRAQGGDNIVQVNENGLEYQLIVTNNGQTTTGVVVQDPIPGWVTTGPNATQATIDAPAGWNCVTSNGSLTCRSGTVALVAGASATITIALHNTTNTNGFLADSVGLDTSSPANQQCVAAGKVPTSGHFHCNTAGVGIDGSIVGSLGESNWTNNASSDWVRVERVANIRTQAKDITSGENAGQSGVESIYRIQYLNEGPSTVNGIVYRDTFTLPAGDSGFTLISAVVAGTPEVACSFPQDDLEPGIVESNTAGGKSYRNDESSPRTLTLVCPARSLVNNQLDTVNLKIRPNVNVGNTGRKFTNIASFRINGGAQGSDGNGSWNYNSVATPADDEKDATLTFDKGEADLLVQKSDGGFPGAVDPLAYDPDTPAANLVTYKLTTTNQGPSLATNVTITDHLQPPAGKTMTYLGASESATGTFDVARCTLSTLASVTGDGTAGTRLIAKCVMPGKGFSGSDQLGILAAGSKSDLFIRYRYDTAPDGGGDTIRNNVVVTSEEDDSDPTDNTADETTTVYMRTDLGVHKTMVTTAPDASPLVALPSSVSVVTVHQPFWYVITGTNLGKGQSLSKVRTPASQQSGTGTVVVDTLPAGVRVTGPVTWVKKGPAYAGATPDYAGTCVVSASTVTCNVGDVTYDTAARGQVRILVPAIWDNLPAGSAAQRGTSQNTAMIKTEQIDQDPSNNTTTVPLDVVNISLSGTVFYDRDQSAGNGGVQQVGEPGIDGVTVRLVGTDAYNNPISVAPVATAGGGVYRFDNLAPSNAAGYRVEQVLPTGYRNGRDNPPISGANAATFNPDSYQASIDAGGTSLYVAKLTADTVVAGGTLGTQGGAAVNYNFPEVRLPSLSGFVYVDMDFNDARTAGSDPSIVGATVELLDAATGALLNTTTTGSNGEYTFANLDPYVLYSVREPLPAGAYANRPTAVNPGTIGGAVCVAGNCVAATGVAAPGGPDAATTDRISRVDLSNGQDGENFNFGESPSGAALSGRVWLDSDNDGVVDAAETGIGGVEIKLIGIDRNGKAVEMTTNTAADGTYSFAGLLPGIYTLIEPNQPSNTLNGKTVPGIAGGQATSPQVAISSIFAINLATNQISTGNNFGEIQAASISGRVYYDNNDNGSIENDEVGIAAVSITLSGIDDESQQVNLTLPTSADGRYSFTGLRPGTYVVTEPNQPPYTTNGITTAGTVGGSTVGVATDRVTLPSKISAVVLAPAAQSVDNNFGEIADTPDLVVSKRSLTPVFTVNNVAIYMISVRNIGPRDTTTEYEVMDRLPAGLTLAETPTGAGWSCTGVIGADRFSCRNSTVIAPWTTLADEITVLAMVTPQAANAGTVNNAVLVQGGGEDAAHKPTPGETNAFEGDVSTLPVCDPAITQNACRVPNKVQLAASVGGTVWFDVGDDDTHLDGGDQRLQGWIVELLDPVSGKIVKTANTAVDGSYRFGDVVPGVKWNLQFRDPSSGVLWAWPVNQETTGGMGIACDAPRAINNDGVSACRVSENGTSQLQVVLEAGQHLPQQSLPVDPSGVVYDAVTRDPVPGSIVTIAPVGVCTGYDPKTAILNAGAGGYRVEGNAVSMTVGNNGYYQFMFGPAAPARCEFQLTVTPPGGYQFVSSLIPAETGSLSPLGAAGSSHLVQPQTGAPTGAVGTPTQYWLNLFAGSAVAGVVHNHIPLDTAQATGLVITKTGDRQTAEIGDTVQYTITVRQTAGSAMATLNVVDTLPRGFTYIDGTGRVGGRAVEDPFGKPGPRLGFNLGPINVGQQLVLTYRVRVGVGAQQGDGINRAQAHGCSISGGCIDPGSMTPVPGSIPSNRAEYRVRVTGGVFTEEACVLGKIFVDCNNNHVQDKEELGIPGVRMYFSNGTWMISDSEGKYSYCGLPPQSHTLKVDPSTLPVGARLTTSSNRNLGDADSLFLDLKNGELHRADFVEGSCSNPLLEQVKARRTQGEVRAPETETGQSQLRFDSKPARAPQQATDSSNQRPIVQPRPNPPSAAAQQEVQP